MIWASTTVAHPHQSLIFSASWDAFLLTTVTSDYLSFYRLPVTSDQSDHSPLTFSSTRYFLLLQDVFFFFVFTPFFLNSKGCSVWKSQQKSSAKSGSNNHNHANQTFSSVWCLIWPIPWSSCLVFCLRLCIVLLPYDWLIRWLPQLYERCQYDDCKD